MSVTRTFTVTVVSTGSGNKYFIDGVQQATILLGEGGTYKFDQSDSSNGNHPLRFSTTSDGTHSGGDEYTTGVTTNGSPGDAGAYTQIVVAESAPTLYYYCTQHSGMGGQANTVDGNSWGLMSWGANEYGSQDSIDVTLTGVSTTSSTGSLTITTEINTGWGQDGWGVENWGASGLVVSLTGVEATAHAGSDVNWGIQTWGGNTWGGEYILEVADVMGLTGLSATSSVGTPTAISDFTLTPTGQSATSSVGSLTIDFNIDVSLTGVSATSSVGTIDPADQVMGLTGLRLNSSLGTVITSGAAVINLTGVSATSSIGALTPADVMGLTGVSATSATGSVLINQGMGLTGVSATASVGNVAPLGYEAITATQSAGYSSVTATQTANYTAVND